MDGFEDNRGLVVLGATNRPGAIDAALIRPGVCECVTFVVVLCCVFLRFPSALSSNVCVWLVLD